MAVGALPPPSMVLRVEHAAVGMGAGAFSPSWQGLGCAAAWQEGCPSRLPCPPPKWQWIKHVTWAAMNTTSATTARERSNGLNVVTRKRIVRFTQIVLPTAAIGFADRP